MMINAAMRSGAQGYAVVRGRGVIFSASHEDVCLTSYIGAPLQNVMLHLNLDLLCKPMWKLINSANNTAKYVTSLLND